MDLCLSSLEHSPRIAGLEEGRYLDRSRLRWTYLRRIRDRVEKNIVTIETAASAARPTYTVLLLSGIVTKLGADVAELWLVQVQWQMLMISSQSASEVLGPKSRRR